MVEINVESNIREIALQMKRLPREIEEKATIRALNRAGDQTVTAANQEIRKVYNLSRARVASGMRVLDRAQRGRLYFRIRISGRRIPVIEFVRGGANITAQRKRRGAGLRVMIKRGQVKTIPRAFITKTKSGHIGAFARAYTGADIVSDQQLFRFGKDSRIRPHPERDLPIAELTTIGVPRMFTSRVVNAAVRRVAVDSFNRNFKQQIKFLSSRAA